LDSANRSRRRSNCDGLSIQETVKHELPNERRGFAVTEPIIHESSRVLLLLSGISAGSTAHALRMIPKAAGHNQCPLGSVNTLGTSCVSPINYEMAPSKGNAWLSGWMNVDTGIARRKPSASSEPVHDR